MNKIYIFTSQTCPYCDKIKVHFPEIWNMFKDRAKFYLINVTDEETRGYVEKFRVTRIPLFVIQSDENSYITIQTSNKDYLIDKLNRLLN